ncbi:hypothetical protein GN956_G15917 [Arapaima gigas]
MLLLVLCLSTQVNSQNILESTTTVNQTTAGTSTNATTMATNTYNSGGVNQTSPSGGGNAIRAFNPTCVFPVIVAAFFLRC